MRVFLQEPLHLLGLRSGPPQLHRYALRPPAGEDRRHPPGGQLQRGLGGKDAGEAGAGHDRAGQGWGVDQACQEGVKKKESVQTN